MIKGDRLSEGRGMNKDTKVTIDMPGDDTKLLMDSHVSHCNLEQHGCSSETSLHSTTVIAWSIILVFLGELKFCIWQDRTLN